MNSELLRLAIDSQCFRHVKGLCLAKGWISLVQGPQTPWCGVRPIADIQEARRAHYIGVVHDAEPDAVFYLVHRSGTAAKVGMGRWQEFGVDGVERLLAHDCVFGRQYGACIGYQLRAFIARLNIVQQPWRRGEQDDRHGWGKNSKIEKTEKCRTITKMRMLCAPLQIGITKLPADV